MSSCGCCQYQDTTSIANTCGAGSVLFMTLVQTLIQTQCSIADPCGRVSPIEDPNTEYDFVVVGAGVAGSVVANRLSEVSNWTVLLLEAGIDEPTAAQVPAFTGKLTRTIFDWNYTTVPQENACLNGNGVCTWPRGKALGGTGILNGMLYIRGRPRDFDTWEQEGNEGWGFDDVLQYFIKSEDNGNMDSVDTDYHGTGGYLPVENFHYLPPLAPVVLSAAKELGFHVGDLNGRNTTGFGIVQMTTRNGVRYSPAKAFLRPVRNRTNLDIITGALASKIIIDPSTNKATGIQYIKNGETVTVNITKEVIVSGGAVNSPQLLLLSGIGPRADLEDLGIEVMQDVPVGKNLHNNVAVYVSFSINDTNHNMLSTETLMEYIQDHTGPLSSTGMSQITGLISSNYSDPDYPDLQLFFGGYDASCSSTGFDECSWMCGRRSLGIGLSVLQPQSRGELKLNTVNPLDHPLMDPKYLSVQQDIEILLYGIRFFQNFTKAEALKSLDVQMNTYPVGACADNAYDSDEYWRCVIKYTTYPENHQSGSVKMGPASDPDAAVDPQLRVHGVPNIRVMDASIFPQVPTGNPMATIFMVGEKGSDMIKETWQSRY